MNFSVQVIEALNKIRAVSMYRNADNAAVARMLIKSIQDSHKYIVPPPLTVKTKIDAKSAPFIRCPFPEMVFEYQIPYATDNNELVKEVDVPTEASTKRVALVIDLATSQSNTARAIRATGQLSQGIAVQSFYWLVKTQVWMPSAASGIWTSEDTVGMCLDGVQNKLTYGIVPTFLHAVELLLDEYSVEETRSIMANDVHEDLCHVLRMLALINARNIQQVPLIEAPERLNKKRLRCGKQPFFAYHTLNVFLSRTDPGWRKRMPDPQTVLAQFRGLPLHMVAGHFKHRKTGIFWWNPHTRGNEAYGKVESEHKVVT